ncbi:MAG: polysaccharide lyase family 8 super-sandwich domain-containing protein [Oscillospiraceae bacterium]
MKKELSFKILSTLLGGLIMFSSLFFGCTNKNDFDFEKVLLQIYDYEMHISNFNIENINKAAENTFNSINENGEFADIDYKMKEQTAWTPASHLTRLKNLVIAYVNSNGAYYKNHEAYLKIVSGLKAWQEHHPISTNWYMQEISSPQNVGVTLVLMRFGDEKVPEETEKAMLKRMKKTGGKPQKWTGANKADIAVHYLYRGALTNDEKTIKLAVDEAFSTLEYTMKEGFQHDNSYLQHGPQLYISGYGNAMINSIAAIASGVANTKYQTKKDDIAPLQGFIKDAYSRGTRGKFRLYNIGGRSIARENSLQASSDILLYEKLKFIDKENSEIYNAAILRLKGEKSEGYMIKPQSTHFWRSDYTLHTEPNFTFDVRTVSNRTYRNENGNKENLKGYFLADGAYSINVSGEEYNNIFPAWDFSLIPGTTTPHIKDIPLPKEWGTYAKNTFAGGLSTGEVGISAYAYNDVDFGINTSANKSYFMIDGKVVCIGSDINSSNENEIRTTLNQCLLSEDAVIINEDKTQNPLTSGEKQIEKAKGIYHGKVGYVFYDDNPIMAKVATQSGTWTEIATPSPNKNTVEKDVFTLSINHGVMPNSASYVYAILPGINSALEVANFDKNYIEILSSTKTLHAVKLADSDKIYAVFFSGGTLDYKGLKIAVDNPCIVMLDEKKLYISNPDQNIEKVKITIELNEKSKTITADMFAKKSENAGKTVCIEL